MSGLDYTPIAEYRTPKIMAETDKVQGGLLGDTNVLFKGLWDTIYKLKEDIQANQTDIQANQTDIQVLQQLNTHHGAGFTGFDNLPLFTILPPMHFGSDPLTAMSEKWTLANGASIPFVTQAQMENGEGFTINQASMFLASGFANNWNNGIQLLFINYVNSSWELPGLLDSDNQDDYKIRVVDDSLVLPNIMGYHAFFRAGHYPGWFEGDQIRTITGDSQFRHGTLHQFEGALETSLLTGVANGVSDDISAGGSNHGLRFNSHNVVPSGDENRPKAIQMAVYIKIK